MAKKNKPLYFRRHSRFTPALFIYAGFALIFLLLIAALITLFLFQPYLAFFLAGMTSFFNTSLVITQIIILGTLLATCFTGFIISLVRFVKQLHSNILANQFSTNKIAPLKKINDALLKQNLERDYFLSTNEPARKEKIIKQLQADLSRSIIFINGSKLVTIANPDGSTKAVKLHEEDTQINLMSLLEQCPAITFTQQNIFADWIKAIMAESQSLFGLELLPINPKTFNYSIIKLNENKWIIKIAANFNQVMITNPGDGQAYIFRAPNDTNECELVLVANTKNKSIDIKKREVLDFSKYTFAGKVCEDTESSYTLQEYIANNYMLPAAPVIKDHSSEKVDSSSAPIAPVLRGWAPAISIDVAATMASAHNTSGPSLRRP